MRLRGSLSLLPLRLLSAGEEDVRRPASQLLQLRPARTSAPAPLPVAPSRMSSPRLPASPVSRPRSFAAAVSYPAPMLTRSFNELTSQILAFKNKEAQGKIVLMYDYDERIAVVRAFAAACPPGPLCILATSLPVTPVDQRCILHQTQGAANLLFEKGFDNVFLLTGGLRELGKLCPQILEGAPEFPPR